jgi:hypothetical protein
LKIQLPSRNGKEIEFNILGPFSKKFGSREARANLAEPCFEKVLSVRPSVAKYFDLQTFRKHYLQK